jgi:hypothetical protein
MSGGGIRRPFHLRTTPVVRSPKPLINKCVRAPAGALTQLAVAVGFEPTVSFHPHTLSRRAPLAARTRHRRKAYKHEAGRTESVRPAYALARRIGDLNP